MADSYNEIFGLGSYPANPNLRYWLKLDGNDSGTSATESVAGNDPVFISSVNSAIEELNAPGPNDGVRAFRSSAIDFNLESYLLNELYLLGDDDLTSFSVLLTAKVRTVVGAHWGYQTSANDVTQAHMNYLGDDIYFDVGRVASPRLLLDNAANIDVWRDYGFVATRDLENYEQVYIDGVSAAKNFSSGGAIVRPSKWSIGSIVNHLGNFVNPATFVVTDFALFNRVLTDSEIAQRNAGPEPLNLTPPTLLPSGLFNVGTWDAQGNGLINPPDPNKNGLNWDCEIYLDDVLKQSFTLTLNEQINIAGDMVEPGAYYVRVAARNYGGSDPAEIRNTNVVNVADASIKPQIYRRAC